MNYPFWEIPILGSGWVIGIIAIFHVMISQFAVGGGLYLPMAERKAMRIADPKLRAAWLKQLASHSKFFLILTAVFGTVSGVGIWFAIGLTHPEATSTLIHNFVFGWAMEWVFFLVELATVAVYYYTWNRIPEKLHLTVGWVYAGASAATLIIINGILAFMLTPGDTWLAVAGTGHEASKFWNAFFNPTYWPSLLLRACVCCSLAGVWALITSSRSTATSNPRSKPAMVQWSVKWLVPSFVAMPFLMIWYYMMVPASQQALLTLGIDTINAGTFSAVTRMALVIIVTSATIIGVAYYLAYRNPLDFNLSHAMAVLLLALIATGAGEYSREMLRKPYVIGRWMYSNGVRVPYVSRINQRRLPGALQLGLERSGLQLLPRRSHLPRRVRFLPHHGRLPPHAPASQRTRPLQHRQFRHHASRLQARHALQTFHATDGRHPAGCQRPHRIPERTGKSSPNNRAQDRVSGTEINVPQICKTAKARIPRAFAVLRWVFSPWSLFQK